MATGPHLIDAMDSKAVDDRVDPADTRCVKCVLIIRTKLSLHHIVRRSIEIASYDDRAVAENWSHRRQQFRDLVLMRLSQLSHLTPAVPTPDVKSQRNWTKPQADNFN